MQQVTDLKKWNKLSRHAARPQDRPGPLAKLQEAYCRACFLRLPCRPRGAPAPWREGVLMEKREPGAALKGPLEWPHGAGLPSPPPAARFSSFQERAHQWRGPQEWLPQQAEGGGARAAQDGPAATLAQEKEVVKEDEEDKGHLSATHKCIYKVGPAGLPCALTCMLGPRGPRAP